MNFLDINAVYLCTPASTTTGTKYSFQCLSNLKNHQPASQARIALMHPARSQAFYYAIYSPNVSIGLTIAQLGCIRAGSSLLLLDWESCYSTWKPRQDWSFLFHGCYGLCASRHCRIWIFKYVSPSLCLICSMHATKQMFWMGGAVIKIFKRFKS